MDTHKPHNGATGLSQSRTPLRQVSQAQTVIPLSSASAMIRNQALGRFSLPLNSKECCMSVEVPPLPQFSFESGNQQHHYTDRLSFGRPKETLERNSSSSNLKSKAAATERTPYRQPTQHLTIVTLGAVDNRSQQSVSQATNQQAVIEKLRHIIEEIWLVVFAKPFQLNLKQNQQRYELCGAVYKLQEAAKQHRQFVQAIAETVGADPSNEAAAVERCREIVDCMIQVDLARNEQQQKMEEYLRVIDELESRIEEEVSSNQELGEEIRLRDEALQTLQAQNRELLDYVRNNTGVVLTQIDEDEGESDASSCLQAQQQLRTKVQSLQKEKGELLLTLERQVADLKKSIELLVDDKIDMMKKLIAAESYINELKITTDHQISDLTQALLRERKVSASLTVNSSLAASRDRVPSPRESRLSWPEEDSVFAQIAQLIEAFGQHPKERRAILSRLSEAGKLLQELRITLAATQQYNSSLEQAVVTERQGNRELRQEISGLQSTLEEVRLQINHRGAARQHVLLGASRELDNSYRNKAQRQEKEQVDLLAFFDDLLTSLAQRCDEQQHQQLGEDILQLLKIVQQKRAELVPAASASAPQFQLLPAQRSLAASVITSPRPKIHEGLTSPYQSPHLLVCSPSLYLKACKSTQKLAMRNDDIEAFGHQIEELFQEYSHVLDQDLLCSVLEFVKQLHQYPCHSSLLEMTVQLINSLKELNLDAGNAPPNQQQVDICLARMQKVFQEAQAGCVSLPLAPEQRVDTVQLEYSGVTSLTSKMSSAQSGFSRQVEIAVQANLEEEEELEQIEMIRGQIRCLQDDAQVFRNSLNICLEETSAKQSPIRQYVPTSPTQ